MHTYLFRFALAIAIAAATGNQAAAEERDTRMERASWTANCVLGTKNIRFHFQSPTGDASSDDMTVVFSLDDDDFKTRSIVVPPALFVPSQTIFYVDNVCENLVGVILGSERLLIFLQYDGRPLYDHIALLLIDTSTNRVIDVRNDLGIIKSDELVLRKGENQTLDIRIIREELTNHGCDCSATYIEDWLQIGVVSDRLHSQWLQK